MLVFLDTEFTDLLDPVLISLGMVADSGEEFYAEVPYPEHACTPFVREAVLPLLGCYPNADCPLDELGPRIINWLQIVRRKGEDVEICVDYQTDWDLFADVMDYCVPPWVKPRHVDRNINELLRYEYHKKNNQPEHHALYDAHGNRYAFRECPSSSSDK